MSGFRRLGFFVLLLAAGVAGFMTLVAWSAASYIAPGGGQSDDAALALNVFGVLTVGCLLGAGLLMRKAR